MTGTKIIHLGGEHTVTGSCHLLQANGLNIMVDCGLAQGNDAVLSMQSWPVAPSEIHYLFLTHAHIDHMGRVPELIERGFSGEIYLFTCHQGVADADASGCHGFFEYDGT